MGLQHHIDRLVCPDCRSSLTPVAQGDVWLALACRSCELVFPVDDDIPILLPSSARNYKLESARIERLRTEATDATPWLEPLIDKTLQLVAGFEGVRSWEWEDEEYWQEKYSRQAQGTGHDRRPVRQWQREILLEKYLELTDFRGKALLDVGCGQGLSFRETFLPHSDPDTLYVGTDIALPGLRLNRERNPHPNTLYVLCSADRLPLRDESIDVLCYFGVLHHTERQERTIAHDVGILAPGGVVMLHEAIIRPWTLPAALAKQDESEHEERLDGELLLSAIEGAPELEILLTHRMNTVVMGAARRVLKRFMRRQRSVWDAVVGLEQVLMRSVGRVVPLFQAGELMILARKRASTPPSR